MSAVSGGPGRFLVRPKLTSRNVLLAVCLGVLCLCSKTFRGQSLTYSGGPIDLGSVTIGSTPSSATLTFNIPSGQTASITSISATSLGASAQDFTVNANTCAGNITGPATCTIKVNFGPVSVGLRRGALIVRSTGNSPIIIPLHGVGVGSQLVFAPATATATSTVTPLSPIYYSPSALVIDGAGNVFFNDFLNSRILEQSAGGTLSTILSLPGSIQSSMAISGNGILYVTVPQQPAVYAIAPGSSATALTFSGASFTTPSGIAIDGNGILYVADATLNRIIRSNLDGSNSTVLTLNGLTTPLLQPEGLAIDSAGNLYIADTGNQRIVKVVPATGAASVVNVNGALFYQPYDVAVDASGTLYVADTGNRRIERISPDGTATTIPTPNFAFSVPTTVVVAANGDLLVADNNLGLVRIARASPTSPLSFPTPTPVGNLDTADGTEALNLQNSGNADLQLSIPTGSATNPSSSNSAFQASSASTCPLLTANSPTSTGILAAGATCTYAVSFTPTVVGPNTGTFSVVSQPTGSLSPITQTTPISGVGTAVTTADTLIVTAPPTAVTGQLTTFTVTAKLNGVTAANYYGTIALSATDPLAVFVPSLTYTFTPADAGSHTFAAPGSGIRFGSVGVFTITANDVINNLTGTSGPIVVSQGVQSTSLTLTSSVNPIFAANNTTLTATIKVPSGIPTGTVTFYDGSTPIGSTTLSSSGTATLTTSFFTLGTHPLTAVYGGSTLFSSSTSNVVNEVVEDFTIANTTPTGAVSALPGHTATFTFLVSPVGGNTFPAAIGFSVVGLPVGATATFNPPSVPAGAGATTTTLTINVPQTALLNQPVRPFERPLAPIAFALMIAPLAFLRNRRRFAGLALFALVSAGAVVLSGCTGSLASGYFGQSPRTYTLTVSATSGTLTRSAAATLTVE